MKLEQGAFYNAELKLNWIEQTASNSTVANKFKDVGFTDVTCTGSKGFRSVAGRWPGTTQEVELPKQVVKVIKL